MVKRTSRARPLPSSLQLAWLREIGLDSTLLRSGRPRVQRRDQPRVPDVSPQLQQVSHQQLQSLVQSSVRPQLGKQTIRTKGRHHQKQAVPQPVADSAHQRPAVATDWQGLQKQIEACQACSLHLGRYRAVFGTGTQIAPQLLVIGDVPGLQDDRYGEPFRGKAGELLQAMLAAVGRTSEIFYTSLIKCRPPTNQKPESAEIAACLPYLQRQIELLQPKQLLILGEMSAQALLATDARIETIRGTVHFVESASIPNIPAVVTYHPAFLLSRPQFKAQVWQDLNLLPSLS